MDGRQTKITILNFSWTNPQFCDPKLNRRKDDFGLTRNDRFIVWDQQKKSWKCSVRTWIEGIVYHSLIQSLCPTDLSMHVVPKATTCRSVPHGHKTDVDSCSSVSTWRPCQRFTGPKGTKHARKSFVAHVHWIQHNPGMPFKTMNAKNLLLVAPGLYLQTPSGKWCQFHWPCSPQRFDELVGSIAHPRLWIERPHLCRPRRGPCKSSPICTNRLACLLLHLKGMVGFVGSQPGVLKKFRLAQNSYIYNSEEPY